MIDLDLSAEAGRDGGLRHVADVVRDVLDGVARRRGDVVEHMPNHPRMEWLFSCVEGMPPGRQKTLILQSRSPEVAFLDDGEADVMLDALGIRMA